MRSLIYKDEAIEAINSHFGFNIEEEYGSAVQEVINSLPSTAPQWKKGKWILVKGSNGKDYHKCSECLHTQDITGVKNYCPVCGADMGGEKDDTD